MPFLFRVTWLAGTLMLASGFAQAPASPAGHWEGTIQAPDREVPVKLDLAKNAQGAWIGSFTQMQGGGGIALADIKVDGASAKFRIDMAGDTVPSFDCTVKSAEAMSCEVGTQMGSVTAALKRTGEAKVDLPKASTSVSAALEGDWAGDLVTPGPTLKLAVHFKNQPDKTVKATLDSPDQGANALPLSDVLEKDSAVEFQLKMAGGAFKGTLNKEGTELKGAWSQGGAELPLTLKKAVAK
jgi:hypothetical protein